MSQVILVISDQHFPFQHPDLIPFLTAIKEKYKPNIVINIGDEVDHNQLSFHEKDADIPFSASTELEAAIHQLSALYDLFPNVYVMESNHGSLVYRRGKYAGLSRSVFREYGEILKAPPGWKWVPELIVETPLGDVLFVHNYKRSCLANSKDRAMNFVQGHFHGVFEISYWANSERTFWGMTVGSSIDNKNMAFNYNKIFQLVPIVGEGLIIDGVPHLIPMIRDENNRWVGTL